MTELNAFSRQPTNTNFATGSQFKFSILQLPQVDYFVNACNLPGINMGEAIFPTPFRNIPVLPDKLTYENLEITFIIDENLQNYRQLHDWMTAIAFPKDREQFSAFRTNNQDRVRSSGRQGSVRTTIPDAGMYSDANLIILTNKNNPILEVRFSNVYPVALSAIQYTQDNTDTTPLTATATFQYGLYEFFDL
jgi:hypothetical protein